MNALRMVLASVVLFTAACSSAERKSEWFNQQATPTGRYQQMKFTDEDDRVIQAHLLRLEKLDSTLAMDDEDIEAKRIIRMLARETQRRGLTRVSEHIVWKIASGPGTAAVHEIYLLDFLTRCQEVIFEIGGDDAPTIENLGAYSLNASRRGPFLKALVAKALNAVHNFKSRELGTMYGGLACDVLERSDWGAVSRIARESDPESPDYRRSTLDALNRYRDRLSR